jgi:uncharacterized membrane protein YdbT with pleckstrin-like domain
MSYADTLLAKGETVLYRARQHWLAPLSNARNGLLLLLGSLALAFINIVVLGGLKGFVGTGLGWLILILFVVGFVWISWVCLEWRCQEYVITNRRVLKVEGLINKKSADSSLEKINDAVLMQSFLGRIMGFGDLDIMTAAETAVDRYQMLKNPVGFKKAMLNAKNDLEDGGRGLAAPAAARPSQPAPAASSKGTSSDDAAATLAKLADLRDRGAITQAEFEAKKADLLGRL